MKSSEKSEGLGLPEIGRQLGIPYPTLYGQFKKGRFEQLPGEGRAKFDLETVRAAQFGDIAQAEKKAPRVASGGGKRAGKQLRAKSAPEKAGATAAAPIHPLEAAAIAAFRAFKKSLMRAAETASEAGDKETEVAVLRALVGVNRKAFVAQLVGAD